MKALFVRAFCAFLICLPPLLSGVFAGAETPVRVVGVTDGDTIRILYQGRQFKVRLHGIDAPESDQPFGRVATRGLRSLLAGRHVALEATTTDSYGRIVAVVYADGQNVNEAMVAQGWAWVYTKHCAEPVCLDWQGRENAARANRLGLWQDPYPVPPWQWRGASKGYQNFRSIPNSPAVSGNGAGGEYSGNVNSRVFHDASCRHFRCKQCRITFPTREAAIAAGFRPCGMCRP